MKIIDRMPRVSKPLLAFTMTALAVGPLSAQPAWAAGVEANNDNTGIEQIIVTANRRAEDLQVVPTSVSAITADQLKDLGITSVGHRRRLLEAIAAPREGDEPTRPTAVADAAPSRLVMAGDRGSRAGKAFENAVLIAPATGELGIACR